jgi:predicted alpha/beta superfamily hydrolase
MTNSVTVQIVYPLRSGRIVLRADMNWEQDIEAESVSENGTVFVFRLSVNRPYFYFKPCIVEGNVFRWARGNNYLAIVDTLTPATKEVWPYFFDGLGGTISEATEVPSTLYPDGRRIRVYFPPGYAENTLKRYPVLYMHDGNNLFFPHEAFTGEEWKVDETMNALDAMSTIDKVIVVGIYAGERMNEYTKPGYERYGRFIVEELKAFVDGTFRTLPTKPNTAVMGSSLAGVVSLYLGWQWPEVFSKMACMSSAFGLQDDLLERIAIEEKKDVRIYLDSGWPGDNYEVTVAMRDLLLQKGYELGKELLYYAFPQALHSEKYWAMRSHIPFQFFFGKAAIFS